MKQIYQNNKQISSIKYNQKTKLLIISTINLNTNIWNGDLVILDSDFNEISKITNPHGIKCIDFAFENNYIICGTNIGDIIVFYFLIIFRYIELIIHNKLNNINH